MDKLELIKQITNYHPDSNAGKSRNWSYYTGGMADTGDWYFRKLIDANITELQSCLNDLIEEWKPRPEPVYTEEEQRQRSNIILSPSGNGWMTEYSLNEFKELANNFERDLFSPKK